MTVDELWVPGQQQQPPAAGLILPVSVANGGTGLSAVGAAGKALGTLDGVTATYIQPPYVWQYDAGHASWSNDNTAHSLLAATKTFPTMAVGDLLHVKSGFTWLNNTAATQTLTVSLRNGAVNLGSVVTGAIAASANKHLVLIDVSFVCKQVGSNVTGSVLLTAHIGVSIATALSYADAEQATTADFVGGNTLACATDGSGGAFDIQVTMSTATATGTVTPQGLIAVYYPKLV